MGAPGRRALTGSGCLWSCRFFSIPASIVSPQSRHRHPDADSPLMVSFMLIATINPLHRPQSIALLLGLQSFSVPVELLRSQTHTAALGKEACAMIQYKRNAKTTDALRRNRQSTVKGHVVRDETHDRDSA
jgi:hypothetical protein